MKIAFLALLVQLAAGATYQQGGASIPQVAGQVEQIQQPQQPAIPLSFEQQEPQQQQPFTFAAQAPVASASQCDIPNAQRRIQLQAQFEQPQTQQQEAIPLAFLQQQPQYAQQFNPATFSSNSQQSGQLPQQQQQQFSQTSEQQSTLSTCSCPSPSIPVVLCAAPLSTAAPALFKQIQQSQQFPGQLIQQPIDYSQLHGGMDLNQIYNSQALQDANQLYQEQHPTDISDIRFPQVSTGASTGLSTKVVPRRAGFIQLGRVQTTSPSDDPRTGTLSVGEASHIGSIGSSRLFRPGFGRFGPGWGPGFGGFGGFGWGPGFGGFGWGPGLGGFWGPGAFVGAGFSRCWINAFGVQQCAL